MIKRLIFDLDNTLILWKDEYTSALIETMKEFNINIDYKLIDDVIEIQDRTKEKMTREDLLNDINKICNLDLKIEFINRLIENQKQLSPENDIRMIHLFEYLSSKYEIVLLTNYFKEAQMGRLEKLGIKKYFKEAYGCEETNFKPNIEAFIKAKGKYEYNECMMIGDSLRCDIEVPKKLGMEVIRVDLEEKIKEETEYKIIKNIYELKNIL